MRPWADHNAAEAGALVQGGIGFQIALHEIVVPAADGEHRDGNPVNLFAGADFAPEGIERGVGDHLAEQRRGPAERGDIGRANRQVQDELGEVRLIARRAHVFGHPTQAVAEFQGAAGGVVAVAIIVIAGDHGEDRLEVRIVAQGGLPLHNAGVGAAHHADFAVRPRLACDPVQGVVAIHGLLGQGQEGAFGFVAPADVLHHHRVAALDEGLVVRCDVRALTVRRANQDSRDARGFRGKEDIGGKAHAIAHGDGHMQVFDQRPLRRGGQARAAGQN